MKKKLKIGIIIVVLGLLAYMGYKVFSKMQYKSDVEKTLQTLPEFHFKSLDSVSFTNAHLKPNTPTVFIYFNSTCDYCQHEAQSISENIDQFKDLQLLFISTESIATIKTFSEHYNLNNNPNITFLYDHSHLFTTQFDAITIPYILIYNSKQQLVKKHKGQLKPEVILKALFPALGGQESHPEHFDWLNTN